LASINEQLLDSSKTISAQRLKLESDQKWLWLLGSLCVLRLLLFATGIFLYVKGIKVPRWVDVLL
jgi:hypothetical protein